jgi:hypothetical protein
MREINKFESEERLVDALRHLAQGSPRNAPPELGTALTGAFHRHHRRRRVKNAAIAALVIICLSSAAWLFTRTSQKAAPQVVKHNPAPASPVEKTMTVNAPSTQETKKVVKHVSGHGIPHHSDAQIEARQDGDFLPLPAYDPAATEGELQIIRVEMPIEDLRLVGAPVNAAMPNQRVLADFVVGQDGTPYAVRLVQ